MVRSKSSGHLSESRSNLLGPSPVGERFHPGERFYLILLINLYLVSIALIIILHNRFHPGERFAFAERLSLGESRAGTNTSLPTSRSISQSSSQFAFDPVMFTVMVTFTVAPIPSSFPNLPLPPWDHHDHHRRRDHHRHHHTANLHHLPDPLFRPPRHLPNLGTSAAV